MNSINLIFYSFFTSFSYLALTFVLLLLILFFRYLQSSAFLVQLLHLFILPIIHQTSFGFAFFSVQLVDIFLSFFYVFFLPFSFLVGHLEQVKVFIIYLAHLIIVSFRIFKAFIISVYLLAHYFFSKNLHGHISLY